MDKDILFQEYNNKLPNYHRARENISEALEEYLKENNISFVTIESRIKDFESFYEKISRKKYSNPFEENEDFCGIRIILYFQDDIEKVNKIIENNFIIEESENKSNKLEDNEFGYRSNHLIIKVKDFWCVTPNYRGLENIKIELQIRTVLMHTWAAIEHKLGYKSNQELPKNLKRKLYLMSAQLENADMQFQEIKNDAENFQHLTVEESKKIGKFKAEKLNIDTLQALLEFYFPNYEKNSYMEINLLDDIIKNKLSMQDVTLFAKNIQPYINKIISKIGEQTTTRANLLTYALQIFAPNFQKTIRQSEDRLDIINEIQYLYKQDVNNQ
ncbi:GTP pyrophosphokinase [Aliarcobacter butzleri]